ncbi:hypothetical protein CsSME_00053431 [Camellia sinensis var. sinensis]
MIDCDDDVVMRKVAVVVKLRMGFGLNNRLAVWKLIPEEMKHKLNITYEIHGDWAIIWADAKEDVFVYFSDI